jgi:hypothetical protein
MLLTRYRAVHGRCFFEEVIRENIDLGRPEQVQLIFARKMQRKTATDGRCRTRIVTEGVSVKLANETGAKGEKVKSLKMEGVHLCCGKCVKAVDKATASVSGVKAHTATKGAKSFEVTGDFNDKDLMTALQKEGLTGKIVE